MRKKNLIDFKIKFSQTKSLLIYFHTDLIHIYKYSVHNAMVTSTRFLFLFEYLEELR